MNAMSEPYPGTEDEIVNNSQGNLEALDVLFSRYRRVLSLVAYHVLGNHEEAENAVQNCSLAASCNVSRFENEGAFRSWLVRALFDEALAILHKNRIESTTSSKPIPDLLNFSPPKIGEQCTSTSGNSGW
jgi:RNA polymerase sigma-70 factor, ECF subfamily